MIMKLVGDGYECRCSCMSDGESTVSKQYSHELLCILKTSVGPSGGKLTESVQEWAHGGLLGDYQSNLGKMTIN